MSALSQIAKDPSCLLAVDALQGGRWLSPLRPPTPRNFADNHMAWDSFQAMQEAADWTHDYTFQCTFKLTERNIENHVTIFYGSAPRTMFGVIQYNTGEMGFFTNLLKQSSSLNNHTSLTWPAANAEILWAGMHTIRIVVQGNAVYYYLDDEMIGMSAESMVRTSKADITSMAPMSASGYISECWIRDDTTGETVWQAAYSDLYDTSKPWPSSVPRNFAEEPEKWYSFTPAYNSIGLDDFELDIVFDINACTQKYVFYDIAAKNGIGIYRGGNSDTYDFVIHAIHVITINEGEPFAGTAWRYNIGPEVSDTISGKFHVKITRIGTTVSCYANGNLVGSRAGTGIAPTNLTGNCSSNFDGSIQEVTLKNLTTGKTVWSYPTWEERVQLLTKTNVRTDRGAFEAADDAKIAGIATPLDFRGNTTSKTFIVRAFCPSHDPASEKLYIHPFFVQGAIQQGTSFYTFQFSLWEDRRSGRTTQLFPTISIGTDSPGANVSGAEIYLDQWHTYAMVIDYNGGNCYIRVFVDGVLLRERIISGTPVWNTPAATTTQETTVGILRDPNAAYYAGSLTRISAAEIAALSYAVV